MQRGQYYSSNHEANKNIINSINASISTLKNQKNNKLQDLMPRITYKDGHRGDVPAGNVLVEFFGGPKHSVL
jgi:hypothetical protein